MLARGSPLVPLGQPIPLTPPSTNSNSDSIHLDSFSCMLPSAAPLFFLPPLDESAPPTDPILDFSRPPIYRTSAHEPPITSHHVQSTEDASHSDKHSSQTKQEPSLNEPKPGPADVPQHSSPSQHLVHTLAIHIISLTPNPHLLTRLRYSS